MKMIGKSVLAVLLVATLLTYSSCDNGGPGGPTVEELQLDKLSGTWAVSGGSGTTNVTLEGTSVKTDYTNFKLTLSGTPGADTFNYSTSGRPNPSAWPSTGLWKFGSAPESMVIRDPDKPDAEQVTITYAVSDTQLQLTFNFVGAGFARTKEVAGEWVFILNKE